MIQFFKQFFNSNQLPPKEVKSEEYSGPSREVFIDDTEPLKPKQELPSKGICPVQKILNHNYERTGYIDGNTYHDAEYMKKKLREIKRKFLNAMNLKLDSLKSEAHLLGLELINCRDISDSLKEKLELSIKFNKDLQERLVFERELSAIDEGMVMTCIHAYQTGFALGTSDYLSENELVTNYKLYN